MRILLLGARGQLGRALFSALSCDYPHWQVVALSKEECNIVDVLSLTDALNCYQPDIIINGAAYTAVDRAQIDSKRAERINHEAVVNLAREARERGVLLVHFSTDYVFDGTGLVPWTEADKPNPINVYGVSKYSGELAIQTLCPSHLIFRTSWLYGGEGAHFARTILDHARMGEYLQVVDDQWGAPTLVHWLANMVLSALAQAVENPSKLGLYHLSCQGVVSWHGFASALVQKAYLLGLLAFPVTVEPISSARRLQAAQRPQNSRLDCRLFSSVFGIKLSSWQEQMMIWLTSQCGNLEKK